MNDGITPNWFAYCALFSWPLVAICLYRVFPTVRATVWTILGAQMLLPHGTAVKVAMIPQFDKTSIPNLCAIIGCIVTGKQSLNFFHRGGLAAILIVANLIAPI